VTSYASEASEVDDTYTAADGLAGQRQRLLSSSIDWEAVSSVVVHQLAMLVDDMVKVGGEKEARQ
jgi:hypothetical protein